jgi:hypothetical protein
VPYALSHTPDGVQLDALVALLTDALQTAS